MPEAPTPGTGHSAMQPVWPGDVTRVPYWVYRDDELLKTEQRQVFEGAVWNYLCLETEIAQPGDWRGTVVGKCRW